MIPYSIVSIVESNNSTREYGEKYILSHRFIVGHHHFSRVKYNEADRTYDVLDLLQVLSLVKYIYGWRYCPAGVTIDMRERQVTVARDPAMPRTR